LHLDREFARGDLELKPGGDREFPGGREPSERSDLALCQLGAVEPVPGRKAAGLSRSARCPGRR